MTKRFLIDCDSVMADFSTCYLDVLGLVSGSYKQYADITTFDFRGCIATQEQDAAVWKYIAAHPELVTNLAVLPGVEDALDQLRDMGDVVCVTAPQWGTSWAAARYKWLELLGFDGRSIVFTSRKSLVGGDFLVDDNHDYLVEWCKDDTTRTPILIEHPWNAKSFYRPCRSDRSLLGAVKLIKELL